MGWNDEWSADGDYSANGIVRCESNVYLCKDSPVVQVKSPSSVADPEALWTNENEAIYGGSGATINLGGKDWSAPLEFFVGDDAIKTIYYSVSGDYIRDVKIESYYDSLWHLEYEGSTLSPSINLASVTVMTKFKISVWHDTTPSNTATLADVRYGYIPTPPDDPDHWQKLTGGMLCNF
jgi:hypothetical protein